MKTFKDDSLKILIVAAEASSALYATHLLKHWQQTGVKVDAFGIGNRDMENLGFRIMGRAEELAVVGLGEIIAHWGDISKAFKALVKAAETEKPDLVLLMDYPEFNMRLAKKVKDFGIPVVYYISPQIWAWRQYRVHKIKKLIDLMLVIFPFEEEFYKKHGARAEFVGHPLVDLLQPLLPAPEVAQGERQKLLGDKKNLLGLMPGSRKSEIKFNLQTQIETAHAVTAKDPSVQPVLFVAPSLEESFIAAECARFGYRGKIYKNDPFLMISLADEILCASGTATLMVALCRKPMVIMYKMKAFTAFLARRLVTHIPYFGMVNLILNREAVPERFQEEANPKELSGLLLDLISDKDGKRQQVLASLDELCIELGSGGGIAKLSNTLLKFLGVK